MRPKSRHRRHHARHESRRGPAPLIGVACGLGVVAVLAVLALPAFVRPSLTPPRPAERPRHNWDAPTGGAQDGLESISRGTRSARAASATSDAITAIRDSSMRYTARRLAEIKDEIAKIDADAWSTPADAERRRALLDEQYRLLRY